MKLKFQGRVNTVVFSNQDNDEDIVTVDNAIQIIFDNSMQSPEVSSFRIVGRYKEEFGIKITLPLDEAILTHLPASILGLHGPAKNLNIAQDSIGLVMSYSEKRLLRVKGIGKKSITVIRKALKKFGLDLVED